jgi:hypothetical protein
MPGNITLLGSGELMSAMSRVHRDALAAVQGPPRPVFLDVTAGFETNVDAIVEQAVEYYRHHLQLELAVAHYRHRGTPASEVAEAVNRILGANLLFAGPGSPTYAIKHLRDTPVWEAVVRSFEEGALVLFASAASIAIGRYSLPVYELYKVGEDPFWAEGLDLFGQIGLSLAVVPHFNDTSGGDHYDTRFCYIGARRFDVLQQLLPPDVTIVGIDGYTAVTFDPGARLARVTGQGGMTTIGDGEMKFWPAGSQVPFDALHSSDRSLVTTHREGDRVKEYEFTDEGNSRDDVFEGLMALVERMQSLDALEKVEILRLLQKARHEVESLPRGDSALMDLLMELRQRFREEKRFDVADMARDRLSDLGYEIHDTPQGSTWARQG